jgi:hypothetical protein
MPRTDRIARAVVADLDESPRLDFWAAVLRTAADHNTQIIGDMVEDRQDDPFVRRVLNTLERRFGSTLDKDAARFPTVDFNNLLLKIIRGEDIGNQQAEEDPQMIRYMQAVAHLIRRTVGIIHDLERFGPAVPIGSLVRGQYFHFTDFDSLYRVVGPSLADNRTYILAEQLRPWRRTPPLFRPHILVYPVEGPMA